jgi:predicted DNA-binding ribbon-helix-helix protein
VGAATASSERATIAAKSLSVNVLPRAEKTSPIKRSIMLHGRKTSVSLEEPFWRALLMIAKERKTTAGALITEIDNVRGQSRNLSSAIRTFVLAYYVSRHERRSPASTEASGRERIRRSERNS